MMEEQELFDIPKVQENHYQWYFLSRQIINNINAVTILIITDRNNLDEQLYNTFAKAFEYLKLPHEPQHIDSNQELIKKLKK